MENMVTDGAEVWETRSKQKSDLKLWKWNSSETLDCNYVTACESSHFTLGLSLVRQRTFSLYVHK